MPDVNEDLAAFVAASGRVETGVAGPDEGSAGRAESATGGGGRLSASCLVDVNPAFGYPA